MQSADSPVRDWRAACFFPDGQQFLRVGNHRHRAASGDWGTGSTNPFSLSAGEDGCFQLLDSARSVFQRRQLRLPMKSLFILLLSAASCFGQAFTFRDPAFVAQQYKPTPPPGGGSSDLLSQMNPNFVWISKSLPSGNVTRWTDLSNGLYWITVNQVAGQYPTNNPSSGGGGVWSMAMGGLRV